MARIDDFISDSSFVILERIKNPFFVSLISAWIYQHRFDVLSLLKSNNSYDDIISIIESEFLVWSRDGFGHLLWLTFLLFFTYTILSQLVYALNALAQKVLRPFLTKWFDKYGYSPAHDLREALDSLSIVESKMRDVEKNLRETESERNNLIQSEKEAKDEAYTTKEENLNLEQTINNMMTNPYPPDFAPTFPGIWKNEYELADGRKGFEYFTIEDGNKYYSSQNKSLKTREHFFNLVGLAQVGNKIIFTKVRPKTNDLAVNVLQKLHDDEFEGREDEGNKVRYTKISD